MIIAGNAAAAQSIGNSSIERLAMQSKVSRVRTALTAGNHPHRRPVKNVHEITSTSYSLSRCIGIYTTFMLNKPMHYNSPKLPLLLERVGLG